MYPVFAIRGATWFLGVAEWTFGLLLLLGFWINSLGFWCPRFMFLLHRDIYDSSFFPQRAGSLLPVWALRNSRKTKETIKSQRAHARGSLPCESVYRLKSRPCRSRLRF